MALPKKILVREVGPREGFQTLSSTIQTSDKLRLISALSETGVTELEVTSFVRPDLVPQMADAAELAGKLVRNDSVKYKALYLNVKGFERAEEFDSIQNDCWVYLSASETFLQRNSRTTTEAVLSKLPSWGELFAKSGKAFHGAMISAAFGCNFEGAIAESKVYSLAQKVTSICYDLGQPLKELSLADTMGRANPEQVKRLVATLKASYPELDISLHLHDTRGTGLANAYAGLLEGVEIFESSVAGLGGCPFAKGAAGNICTEDLAYLCHEIGIETGLDLKAYVKAAQLAESIVGESLPGKYYKSCKSS